MIPILVQTDWFTIQTIHFFFVLALILSTSYLLKKLKRRRMELLILVENFLPLMLWTLFCARLFAILDDWGAYELSLNLDSMHRFLSIWDNTLSSDAGIFAFILGLVVLLRKKGLALAPWMDAMIPSILIVIAVTEIGAFFSGYAYGIPSDLPWAIEYAVFHVQYTSSVHPTQLYTLAWILLIFGLEKLWRKKSDFLEKESHTALFFLSSFMLGNSVIELLRGSSKASFFHLSSVDFVIYFSLFLIGSYKLWKAKKSA